MKRKSMLSVTVALGFSLILATLVSTTHAQPPQRYVYRTGVVKLGPDQVLRITIDWGDGTAGQVRFGRTLYTQGACNSDGVCQLSGSNTYTGATTLERGVVASCDVLAAGTYGRGILVTTSQKVQVSAAIVNATSGATDVLIGLLLPENITLTEVLISRFDAKVTIVRRRSL
jgi:autotransporter-associated beta strand protein